MKLIVANIFGGPGVSKTSIRADVFSRLKWSWVNCEESTEYVKAKQWEGTLGYMKNQLYIFGKQHNQVFRLRDKVDVVITDAPLLNSIIYDEKNDDLFRQLVFREFNEYDNLNFLINRTHPYDPNGRHQNEEQAKIVDLKAEIILKNYNIKYNKINGGPDGAIYIFNSIMEHLTLMKNAK